MSTHDAKPVDGRLAKPLGLCDARSAQGEDVPSARPRPGGPAKADGPETQGGSADTLEGLAVPTPRVAGYEIVRELGRGGAWMAYLARDVRHERDVALKLIAPGFPGCLAAAERFVRDAAVMAGFTHSNIVGIYDFGTAGGRPYLALEYMRGGSLDSRWGNIPQPAREAAEVLRIVSTAVHAAHESAVLHGGLKPRNILFDEDGTPKVADFGLARPVFTRPTPGEPGMVSLAYMAPEEARREWQRIGLPSDVYSLGCLLYLGLTGRPPLGEASRRRMLRSLLDSASSSPSGPGPLVPFDLAAVCMKCLEREPEDRYQAAGELAEDLARFLAGESVRARPIGLASRLGWRMRHRAE